MFFMGHIVHSARFETWLAQFIN